MHPIQPVEPATFGSLLSQTAFISAFILWTGIFPAETPHLRSSMTAYNTHLDFEQLVEPSRRAATPQVCRDRCLNNKRCTVWTHIGHDARGFEGFRGSCSLGFGAISSDSVVVARRDAPDNRGVTSGEVLELWKLQASR
jgi:hypothetical protein